MKASVWWMRGDMPDRNHMTLSRELSHVALLLTIPPWPRSYKDLQRALKEAGDPLTGICLMGQLSENTDSVMRPSPNYKRQHGSRPPGAWLMRPAWQHVSGLITNSEIAIWVWKACLIISEEEPQVCIWDPNRFFSYWSSLIKTWKFLLLLKPTCKLYNHF